MSYFQKSYTPFISYTLNIYKKLNNIHNNKGID